MASKTLKIALGIIFRLVLFLIMGIVINLCFGIFLLFSATSAGFPIKILLLILFLGLLPLYYLWRARGFAFKLGLRQIYNKGDDLLENLVRRISKYIIEKNEGKDGDSSLSSGVVRKAVFMAEKAEGMPRILRFVFTMFFRKIPLAESFSEIKQDVELKSENLDEISRKAFHKIDNYVKEELLDTGMRSFWILIALNLALMAGVTYFWIYQ